MFYSWDMRFYLLGAVGSRSVRAALPWEILHKHSSKGGLHIHVCAGALVPAPCEGSWTVGTFRGKTAGRIWPHETVFRSWWEDET